MKLKNPANQGTLEECLYLAEKAQNYKPPKITKNQRRTIKDHLPVIYDLITNSIRFKSNGTFTYLGNDAPIKMSGSNPVIHVAGETILTHEIIACKFLELTDDYTLYIVHLDGDKLNHKIENLKFFDSKLAVQKYYFDLRQAKKIKH